MQNLNCLLTRIHVFFHSIRRVWCEILPPPPPPPTKNTSFGPCKNITVTHRQKTLHNTNRFMLIVLLVKGSFTSYILHSLWLTPDLRNTFNRFFIPGKKTDFPHWTWLYIYKIFLTPRRVGLVVYSVSDSHVVGRGL